MDIYQPAEDSYLLQKHVKKYAFGRVLDLGTGSGIQALTAIKNKEVREVVAVDVNKNAIEELNNKVKSEKIRKVKVIFSHLFSNVRNKFDTIIFNPPYLPQDKVGKEIIEDASEIATIRISLRDMRTLSRAYKYILDAEKNKDDIYEMVKANRNKENLTVWLVSFVIILIFLI